MDRTGSDSPIDSPLGHPNNKQPSKQVISSYVRRMEVASGASTLTYVPLGSFQTASWSCAAIVTIRRV